MQTLLVFAKDKKKYEKWVRDMGMRVSNIQYVFAADKDDVKGWETKDTFYTIMDEPKKEKLLNVARGKYKFVDFERLQGELKKKKKMQQAATQ